MNTKALRQKILDLAIHGKLVPQDPNDEPASVLLERIRAEKERLIKEGKIKKPKKAKVTCDKPRYPFQLPEGWVWTTVGELFTLQAGKNITAKNISPTQNAEYKYPCFGGNGIRGFVMSSNRNGSYPIIGRQGALCGNVNLANGEFYATEHAVVVDFYCETDFMWCYYTLEALNLNQYATATAQPGLAVNIINEVSIPLPPYKEQKVISEAISHWFSLVDTIGDSKEQLLIAIGQAKSKILDLAIHGKLVPQDSSDEPASELLKRINSKAEITCDTPRYGKLPKSWVWATLGEISNYGDNKSVAVENIDDNEWILELEDLEKDTANIIQKSKKKERIIKGVRHSFSKGNILYSKLRTYLNKVLIAPSDGFCTTEMIAFDANEQISNAYICHVLRSNFFVDYTQQCGYGVKMPRLSTTDARKGLIPLPPINEQHRIVAKIEELFAQLDKIESSL